MEVILKEIKFIFFNFKHKYDEINERVFSIYIGDTLIINNLDIIKQVNTPLSAIHIYIEINFENGNVYARDIS